MDLDTWVSVAALAIAGVTLYSAMARTAARNHTAAMAAIAELRTETKSRDDELAKRIDTQRDELIARIDNSEAALTARLAVLEQRTYDIATRLIPSASDRHTG